MRCAHIVALALTAALTSWACSLDGSAIEQPDAADGDASTDDADASPQTSGIVLSFDAIPDVPGDAGGPWNVSIDSALIRLADIRVLGDSGSPQREAKDLRWDGGLERETIAYPDAPPGQYSLVRAKIDECKLNGTLEIDEESLEFEIELEEDIEIEIDLGTVLVSPGEVAEIEIAVRLGDLVNAPEWSDAGMDGNGRVVIDDEDEMLADQLESALDDAAPPIFDADD